MAKTIKAVVNTGKPETDTSYQVVSGSGAKGKPTRIQAIKGARYQLEDPAANNVGPDNIRSKRVGKNLHVMLEGNKEADLIIEGYYDEANQTSDKLGLYGRAEDGKLYEYIPENPSTSGMPVNLADGGKSVSQVLGGGSVAEGFGLAGLPLVAAAAGGFNALTAVAAGVGAAALAGGGGGGGGDAAAAGGGGGGTPALTPVQQIQAAAQANTAVSSNLAASVFTGAGVTGVDSTNLAAVQSALDSAAIDSAAVDTPAKVQAIVDAVNAIKANADGTANNFATNPTQAQYTALGVTGVDSTAKESLLGDVIDAKPYSGVDSTPELQALANAAAAVLGAATGGTAPTLEQLQALGVTGVTTATLNAVQNAIAATGNTGAVDTLSELQTVVDNGVANAAAAAVAALGVIETYAEANTAGLAGASGTAPTVNTFAAAGVTGVTSANLAAIQDALASSPINGAAANTTAEVQAIVDAYTAILAEANGSAADANAQDPSAAQYANIGATIGAAATDADNLALLNDIVGAAQTTGVDTVAEINELARIANAIQTVAAGGTPSPALTDADLAKAGLSGVTPDNLADVLAAIAAKANDGTETDSVSELQALVNGVTAAATAALSAIQTAAQNNTAASGNLAASVFASAGVTGVSADNLAAVQSALDSATVNGAAADTKAEVQAIVDAANAVKANADGTANNFATNPTQAQYTALGVTGVDNATKETLLGDVIDAKPYSGVDSTPELQALANAVAAVMAGNATKPQLEALGVTGVTDNNLSAIQAALAAATDATQLNTLGGLQTVVTAAADALSAIQTAAQNNSATPTSPSAAQYAAIGVTGVTASNLAAINTALNDADVQGAQADTQAEVQAIVDGFKAILDNADTASTANPTQANYAAIGVSGVDTAPEVGLLGDVIDAKAAADVDSVVEVQALADAAQAVMDGTATQTQLELLGVTGVSPSNLSAVQAALAAATDATQLNTLGGLQTVVSAATGALSAIQTAAENNSATPTSPSAAQYAAIGVTGVTAGNLAAINSALNSDDIQGAQADTQADVQAIVDAYTAILAEANGATADANAQDPSAAQYAAIGVIGVDPGAEESLLGDVIGTKPTTGVDTVDEVQALADAVQAVMDGTANQTQLELLGVTGVTPQNIAAVQAALAAANDNVSLTTLSGVQGVVSSVVNALDTIQIAAENNTATSAPIGTQVFANAGVTGVTSSNLAAVQSALDSAAVNGAAADTKAEVQAIVDAANAVKANADGTANNFATNPTQAQYTALGVTGVNTTGKETLLGDIIDAKPYSGVDSTPELQALADAVAAVFNGAAGGTAPTLAQLQNLGFDTVTADNLGAVQSAIAATADNGGGVDTLPELQAIVTAGVTAAADAITLIKDYAQANTMGLAGASGTAPTESTFVTAGVTGVTSANLNAVKDALASSPINGAGADTKSEIQAIVDAYTAILAEANDTNASAGDNVADATPTADPTAQQYANIGATIGAAATDADNLALLNDIVGAAQTTGVDTVAEINELARIANAIQTVAAGGTPSPALTDADLAKAGLSGVTADNLPAVLAAIVVKPDTGADTDALSELQALVNSVNSALGTIAAAAQNNDATSTTPSVATYSSAGITGVSSANLPLINDMLNTSAINGAAADSVAEVQALVNALAKTQTLADGTAAATPSPALTTDDITALGLGAVIDTAPKLALFNAALDQAPSTSADSAADILDLARIANAIQTVAAGGTPSPALSTTDLGKLGLVGVTAGNLAAVTSAIAATADNGTGADSLAELQALINNSNWAATSAPSSIAEATNGISATELADGIQAVITIPTGAAAGDTLHIELKNTTTGVVTGTIDHVLTAQEAGATSLNLTVPTSAVGTGAGKDGSYTLTTHVTRDSVPVTGATTSTASSTTHFTLDTTAPSIVVKTIAGNDTTAASADGEYSAAERGNYTNPTASQTVTVTGTTDAEVGTQVQVTINSKTYTANVTAGSAGQPNNWSVELGNADSTALVHGSSYTVSVKSTDVAGNVSTDSSHDLVINIAPPDIPTINALQTGVTKPTLSGQALKEDPSNAGQYLKLSTGDTVAITVNGTTVTGTVGTNANGFSYNTTTGTWTLNTASVSGFTDLTTGNYNVAVTTTAGSVSKTDISANELKVNTNLPTIQLGTVAGDGTINALESASDVILSGTTNAAAGSAVTVTLNSQTYNATVQTGTPTNTFSVTVPAAHVQALPQGSNTVGLSVVNEFGVTTNASPTLTLDTIKPGETSTGVNGTVPKPVITIAEAANGISASELADGIQVSVTLPTGSAVGDTLRFSVTDANSVVRNFDHVLTSTTSPATITVPTSVLSTAGTVAAANGSFSVVVTPTDVAGNPGAASTPVNFTVDTQAPGKNPDGTTATVTAPVLSLPEATDGSINATDLANGTPTGIAVNITLPTGSAVGDVVTLTITDPSGDITTVSHTLVAGDLSGSFALTIDPSKVSEDGTYTLSATTTDVAGNASTAGTVQFALTAALTTLSAFAQAASTGLANATGAPALSVYQKAGMTGVDANNLAAINDILASSPVDGAATDTKAKVQAIVDAYNAILQSADGTANNDTTNPTAAQYAAIGVTGLDTAAELSLMGDVLDTASLNGITTNAAAVDTVAEIQALADAVQAVLAGAAGGTAPTLAQLQALGLSNVNSSNLAAVQAAIAATADNGGDVDTLGELNTVVANALAGQTTALDVIAEYAATGTTVPTTTHYTSAGVTGVTSGNLDAVNSAIKAQTGPDATNGNTDDEEAADTPAEVQAIVNAYADILAAADGTDANTTGAAVPTQGDYQAIGVTGTTAASAALLSDVIDGKATAAVDTVAEVQALADAAKAVLGYDDPTTDTAPTKDQINALVAGQTVGGNAVPAVTDDALKAVQAAIDTANSDGTPLATQADVAAVVKAAMDSFATGLNKIADYAATSTVVPDVGDYSAAGVTGVTSGNLDAVNSAIKAQTGPDATNGNTDDKQAADTAAEVQAIVNAYNAILAEANGATADAATQDPTATQYAAIGVTGVDAGVEETLLGDVIGGKATADVDTVAKVQALANAVQAVMDVAALDNTLSVLQAFEANPAVFTDFATHLSALGLSGVNADNAGAVWAAVRDSANNGSAVDTLAKLQTLIAAANDRPVLARSTLTLDATEDTPLTFQVSSLLTSNNVTDADAAASFTGIAIHWNQTTSAQGTWQWSADGSTNWAALPADITGTVQADSNKPRSAFWLNATDHLRFVPAANYSETNTAQSTADGRTFPLLFRIGDNTMPTTASGARVDSFELNKSGQSLTDASLGLYLRVDAVNDAPTGSVTVSGTARVDQTLTASNTLADVDGTITGLAYQWQVSTNGTDWSNISGAIASTYVLTANEQGKQVRAVASYTAGGFADSVSASPSATIGTSAAQVITDYAQNNGGTAPVAADYADLGVTGIGGNGQASVASVNNALATASITGAEANTQAKVQAIVNAYTAILAEANGATADAATQDPTAAQYAAIGVTGVDAGVEEALLGDVIGGKTTGDVDTVAEVQALADTVAKVIAAAAGGTAPTQTELESLGLTGVNAQNIAAVQAAIAATADNGTGVDTLADLQALVNNANDLPTGGVTITGTPKVGQTLTASTTESGNVLADADGLGTLSYKWFADGTEISGATGNTYQLAAGDLDKVITAQVSYTDGGGAAESKTSAATPAVTAAATAGDAVIDLGAGNGKLVAPVQVEGKWYYYWDRNGDGSSQLGNDAISHDALDQIFKYDINMVERPSGLTDTNDTYRYALLNGVLVGLPTINGGQALPQGMDALQNGTAATTGGTSSYDDLLAIWDTHNGTGVGTNVAGTPSGWINSVYWSASTTATSNSHAYFRLNTGEVLNVGDVSSAWVALEVVKTNAAPDLDTSASPTLSILSGTTAAPTNGQAVGSLVSSLVGGISDADSGAAKGIAITSVDANGTLYYSTNGGSTWTAASGISATNALLLAADADTRVFFKPNSASYAGNSTAISFKAWDLTQHITEGVYANTAVTGGKSEFSANTDTVAVSTVNQVVNADGSISVGAGYGGQAGSYLGNQVSSLGDVNGDGYDDVIVGTHLDYSAYVVFGNASGIGYNITGGSLDASQGFKITGQNQYFGMSGIAGVSDVNGDGFADFALSEMDGGGNNNKTYVIYGKANIGNVSVSSIAGSTQGYVITHGTSNQLKDIASVGDVNGDGLADMVVTPGGDQNAGTSTAYVIYGSTNGGDLNLTSGILPAGRGFKLTAAFYDYMTDAVSGAGDFNGDGYADLLVGADAFARQTGSNTATAYIVYGSAQGANINLTSGLLASQGFKITGDLGGGARKLGSIVSSAGDINGDGLSDVMVSDPQNSAVYVVYGNTGNLANFSVSAGTIASSLGFKISGVTGSSFGKAVSSAGDINGDGLADMVVGSYEGSGATPATYVVYGKATNTNLLLTNGTIAASDGFKITGLSGSGFGSSVSNAGDINGDGLDDLIVGALNANSNAGAYHLILGGTTTVTSAINGTGTSADEAVMGTAGNDTLAGGGGVDRFFAGKGNDTIVLAASDVSNLSATTGSTRASIDGGTGYDTLRVSAAGMNLNLTNVTNVGAMGLEENSRIEDIERIDLGADGTANTLTIAAKDVNDMAGFNLIRTGSTSADGATWTNVSGTALSATTKFHQVVVDGTSSDGVTLAAGNGFWANVGTVNNGSSNYVVWQNTGTNSQVIVKSGVVVTNNDATAAGDTVIDLGASGKLIAPVQVEGKWYYYWDRSGDGTNANTGSLNGGTDFVDHDVLDSIFKYDINMNERPSGVTETNDTYRYALINGVLVGLPTANGGQAYPQGIENAQNGTAFSDAGASSNGTQGRYDEMLAVWDAFNGTSTGTNLASTPTGWVANSAYWTATSNASNNHITVHMQSGVVSQYTDTNALRVALEVVKTNAAPTLADTTLTLSSVHANTTPTGAVGDLVSSLVGGISDGDAGAAKGIAITGAASGGTVWYSLNGGTTWASVAASALSNTNALLLAGDSDTRVYFQSATGATTVSNALTIRAWDMTQHITEGVFANTSANGSRAEFSSATDTVGFTAKPTMNVSLNAVAAGTGGFVINGETDYDRSGYSVTGAGDVNGDGFDDVVVSAPGAGSASTNDGPGRTYVVFGSGNSSAINLTEIATGSSTKGFVIDGQSVYGGHIGNSYVSAGDLNGDGLSDLLIGEYAVDEAGNADVGRTFVVYGKADTSTVNLSSLTSGASSQGFAILGESAGDRSGISVSTAGDLNGDGLMDLIIGATGADNTTAGRSYVVYGTTNNAAINLSALTSGSSSQGFVIHGEGGSDRSGIAVSGGGDINGDGLADLLVSSIYADPAGAPDGGKTYVVFGSTSSAAINLSALTAGTSSLGFVINGIAQNDNSGKSISNVGDINGDGYTDLIVGVPSANWGLGRTFVVYGKSSTTAVNLSSLAAAAGSNGFELLKDDDVYGFGHSVSGAGDINGDGLSDLLVSSPGNTDATGVTFVVFGSTNSATVSLSSLTSGTSSQGFVIKGGSGDSIGQSISAAGDVNGDGYADLMVSAQTATHSGLNLPGRTFVIYGGSQFSSGAVALATGTSASEAVMGTAGNDTLTGGGGVDRFFAGKGNDTIVLSATDVSNLSATTGATRASIDGGTGYDTLRVSAAGVNLNLTSITNTGAMGLEENSRIESIERIDLGTDSTANTLTIAARDVNDMAGFNLIRTGSVSADGATWSNVSGTALSATTKFHQVVVDGTSSDGVTLAAGNGFWANVGTVNNGSSDYVVWQNTATNSQVIVKSGVVVTNNDLPPVAGDTVIDLGASGKLIAPVQVEGKWYYYWDRNADGSASNATAGGVTDFTNHNTLDALFNQDINGNVSPTGETTDVYRYGTIAGVRLALPTANGGMPFPQGTNTNQNGTAATGGGQTNNSTYDELLAIWDNFNGTGTSNAGVSGTPSGWISNGYWSATPSASGHSSVQLDGGGVNNSTDTDNAYVALQVVQDNAAPVLDTAASPALSILSGSTAAPTNGQAVGSLVSSLVGGISDADSGAAKGIAITSVDANGTLYYSTNGGTTWTAASGISATNALLLAADADTRVFFKPNSSSYAGNSSAISFKAWDLTQHITEGVYADTTVTGGKSEFSTATDTVAVSTVNQVVNGDGSISLGAGYGGQSNSYLGYNVSSLGDVNGDGYDDVIVGTYNNSSAYVVFGNASGTGYNITGGSLEASQGFKISSTHQNFLGWGISGAGDVNGDGFADIVLTGSNSGGSANAAYIIYGKANLSNLNVNTMSANGVDGVWIRHADTGNLALAAANAGDVNGDGLNDVIVTAGPVSETETAAYVVYGNTTGADLDLRSRTIAADKGFKLSGARLDMIGKAVSGAGDFNGDGYADLLVGADGQLQGNTASAYIVYGGPTGTSINLTSGLVASQGFRITGTSTSELGHSVASAGDVNGDGFSDVIVADLTTNSVYVIYGNTNNLGGIDLSSGTMAASLGFKIQGLAGSIHAKNVSSAGDVNGDGLADMIIGANYEGSSGSAPATYVVYGKTSNTTLTLSNGIAATDGFKILGQSGTGFGYAVSNAGDINGDGLADLIVGAPETNSNAGAYHLILGGTTTVTSAINGTGTSSDEAVLGTAGNDTLTGGGGVDRFFAGKGNDTIVLQASDVSNLSATTGSTRASIDGGTGYDTLQVSASGVNLNLTSITNVGAMGLEENSRIEGIERIDLGSDSTANTLTIAARDVNDMAGFNLIRTGSVSADGATWTNVSGTALSATTQFHQVVVDGTSSDGLTLAAGNGYWFNAGTVNNGSSNYVVWQNTATNSQVIVKDGVVVTNNDSSLAGEAVIDLGVNGKLIAPVQVEGKWYYYWDISGDGTADSTTTNADGEKDFVSHDFLDSLFNKDSNGLTNTTVANTDGSFGTTDTYRYATINGIKLALPTAGSTSIGSNLQDNQTYTDLAEIWDAYNSGTGSVGAPANWLASSYWSATSSSVGHLELNLTGLITNADDTEKYFVALQVLPVVIDLNRDGILSYGQVTMDVNGDGALDITKWAGAQDGVLVWDKFGDGLVHDNSQYAFAQYATTYENGSDINGKAPTDLSGLAEAFDSNQDGVFNAEDAQFAEFKVWQDADQDGISDEGEVKSLADWGLSEINLTSDGVVRTPAAGVTEAGRTTATATDGSSVLVSDAAFEYVSASTTVLKLDDLLQLDGAPAPAPDISSYSVYNTSLSDQLLLDAQGVMVTMH